jgi:hypothetical protein
MKINTRCPVRLSINEASSFARLQFGKKQSFINGYSIRGTVDGALKVSSEYMRAIKNVALRGVFLVVCAYLRGLTLKVRLIILTRGAGCFVPVSVALSGQDEQDLLDLRQ